MSMVPADPRAVAALPLPQQIEAKRGEFLAVLPRQIPPEKFMGVVMTALRNNPALAKADRQSFFLSALRAAQDGLLPDGREGALVIYGGKVNWLPMVAGIKKRVRQSGEIATWDAHVARAHDDFDFALGDDPFIRHKPKLDGDRGPIIAAYSVATLKSGEKSREIMTKAQIDQVKRASKSSGSGPWKDWEEEMCRKSVLKRHAKSLPMSTEVGDIIQRDNEGDAFEAAMSAPISTILDPLADEAPSSAVDWSHEVELYAGDLGECDDGRALSETIERDGARFVDAPAEVQADVRKVEAAERARVERAAA